MRGLGLGEEKRAEAPRANRCFRCDGSCILVTDDPRLHYLDSTRGM